MKSWLPLIAIACMFVLEFNDMRARVARLSLANERLEQQLVRIEQDVDRLNASVEATGIACETRSRH